MGSERLRWLGRATGPFASVYFDDSHDTAGAAEQLETKWHDIRKHIEDRGASTEIIGTLEEAVLNRRPPVGRCGRAVIATSDQVLINEQLISPPPVPVTRLSDYPYVVPLLDLEIRRPTYVVAVVDHAGADVALHQGDTISSTCIEGAGFPVHKPATAGWNGYGDFQHTTEEAIRMNARAVAQHLTRLVDQADPQVVFVCGEVRSRANVVAELPARVARRVTQQHAQARNGGIDTDEINRLATAEFARRQCTEMSGIINRFEAEIGRGSGLAAEGLAAVCAALRDSDVDTLILGELGDATVVTGKGLTSIAPDADVLSEFGEPVARIARADEALPFAAIATGASLVRADQIAPTDGVGALLRFAATDRLAGRQP
jgi:peptide subunit release factor 1 (eRF1)